VPLGEGQVDPKYGEMLKISSLVAVLFVQTGAQYPELDNFYAEQSPISRRAVFSELDQQTLQRIQTPV
jgi:hypothetical protein